MIYLDHLTTTRPLPEVVDAMQPWLREQFGAPAALHRPGLEARDAIDEARAHLAKLVNAAEPGEMLFTSSGTEAINHAVKGAALATRRFGSISRATLEVKAGGRRLAQRRMSRRDGASTTSPRRRLCRNRVSSRCSLWRHRQGWACSRSR